MKKFLLGIIAIVLAVSFSSFSNEKSKKTDDPVYYFYAVDDNGVIPSNSPILFGGGAVTLAVADANDNCTGSLKDCVRGFSTQPTLPTSSIGDVRTKKD